MAIKSKKIKNKHYNRKSLKRNRKSRKNRKSNKNKRFKKYGGEQTRISVTYYGDNFYQPNNIMDISTTIKNLIDTKRNSFNLYHRGKLLSTYPLDKRVFDVLPEDGQRGHYNIQVSRKIEGEEPPEKIEITKIKSNVYMPNPYDDDL
jgi:hypothetical protein